MADEEVEVEAVEEGGDPEVTEEVGEGVDEVGQEGASRTTNETPDQLALRLRLEAMKRDAFSYMPPGAGDTSLMEITSARVKELMAMTEDDKQLASKIAGEASSFDKIIEQVQAKVIECESVRDEVQVVYEELLAGVPALEKDIMFMTKNMAEDKKEVAMMRERLDEGKKTHAVLGKEMVKWRELVSTWEDETQERKRLVSKLKDETKSRKAIIENAKQQLHADKREVRKIAEEMGDLSVSVGADNEADLDLDNLTIEGMDGKMY